MRKLGFVALLATACFLGIGSEASATSVNLKWVAGSVSAGSITGIGSSSVTIAPSAYATLTLDVQINVDAAGLSSAFLSLRFDTDLLNELNIVSFQEIAWTGVMMTSMALPELSALSAGLSPTQESTGALPGLLYTFDAVTTSTATDCCPVSTTVAFGRVVFTTNHSPPFGLGDDGADVFSGLFNAGVDFMANKAGGNISGTTTYGTARVNQIPEPSTLGLLGLGLSALVVAGRRRSRI
jgi:hypothetical protein